MNVMKKRLLLLSALTLLLTAPSWAYDFKVDGIYYNILSEEDLTCEVTYRYYSSSSNADAYTGKVVIPETATYLDTTYSVVAIGEFAFNYCKGLTQVTIPNSVTTIGDGAFADCTALTSITSLNPTPPSCGNHVFNDETTSTCVLYVPEGSEDAYSLAPWWRNFFGGTTTAISVPQTRAVVISTSGNGVSVSGLDDGESVALYDLSGILLSSATASGGRATLSAGGASGVVIVKLGERAIKTTLR